MRVSQAFVYKHVVWRAHFRNLVLIMSFWLPCLASEGGSHVSTKEVKGS